MGHRGWATVDGPPWMGIVDGTLDVTMDGTVDEMVDGTVDEMVDGTVKLQWMVL